MPQKKFILFFDFNIIILKTFLYLVKPKTMKKYLLLLPSILFLIHLSAQPIINQNDMPSVGDTLTLNIASSVTGLDYATSGCNYTWDLSGIVPTSQRIDTFKAVSTLPQLYSLVFSNATFGVTAPDMVPVSTGLSVLSITNVHNFFLNETSSYSQLGYGAKFNGFALPVKFDNPDVVLNFPLTLGEKDSCDFAYFLDMSSTLGMYYGESKHRVNYVDAWGKVITPVDTFMAMRVLSKITAHDTIHLDTLGGFGFAFNYTVQEYKWYAKSMKVPVMNISVRSGTGAGTTAEYPNLLNPHTDVSEFDPSLAFLDIYPNPADENTELYFSLIKISAVEIDISDMLGRNIKTFALKEYPEGFNSVPLNIQDMEKGIYFVRINAGNSSKVIKMQVQ
jgi:hypothetical protein